MQEMKEMWVRSLGQEDPLEVGTTNHSSILAWKIPWTKKKKKIPWTRETDRLQDLTCRTNLKDGRT